MNLSEWHTTLKTTFEALSKKRAIDYPIFALEHGLTSEELGQLKVTIEDVLSKNNQLNRSFYLPWVVYSSEVGYEYSGDEYWQTFEEKTKYWARINDRHFIRDCFIHFEKEFRAVKPTGEWAKHFSIISRPITNAILPADLQKDLIEILYDIKHKFTKLNLENIESLGEIIRDNSWHKSSRVQTFLQETKLVGHFTKALLLSGKNADDSLISQVTLKRIIKDLEKTEKNKFYLRETKSKVEKVFLTGTTKHNYTSEKTSFTNIYKEQTKLPSIKPSLKFYRKESVWDLLLKIPEMTLLSNWSQRFHSILNEGKLRIPYSNNLRPFIARNLLSASKDFILTKWPNTHTPIIEFLYDEPEPYSIYFNDIYNTDFPFVFKIISDNYAEHISSRALEVDSNYLVIFDKNDLEYTQVGNLVDTNCDNIIARIIDSNSISPRILKEWGYSKLESITIKPLCYPYCNSDEVGVYEYSVKETPSFIILCSYEVISLKLELLDDCKNIISTFDYPSLLPDDKLIIQLSSNLDAAKYLLKIEGTIDKDGLILQTHGNIEICIREQKSNLQHNCQTIIQTFISPLDSSLEDLWENKIDLKVLGPTNSKVTPKLRFLNKNRSILKQYKMTDLPLPIFTNSWIMNFDKLKSSYKKEIGETYDESSHVSLILDNDNFGSRELFFSRSFKDFRWIYRKNDGKYLLKMLFESDKFDNICIHKYSFSNPLV